MQFRDLREGGRRVPEYNTSVLVRADIALDRAYCLNEIEAESYLRSRLTETMPFKVGRISLNHKERRNGASIWETEFTLGGKIQTDKPTPRDEIKKIVSDLVKKVGFGNADVQVRSAEKVGTVEKKEAEPSLKAMTAMAKNAIRDRAPSEHPVAREDALRLRRGDKIVVSRSGFRESAAVLGVDATDDSVEVRIESTGTNEWIPFVKITEIEGIPKAKDLREEFRRYGPGKFDTIVDSHVYRLSLDGVDEETGDVSEVGVWYGLLRKLSLEEVEKAAAEDGDTLTSEEREYLKTVKGAIVSENDQGFVSVSYFTDDAALAKKWKAIESEIEKMYEPEEGEEEEEPEEEPAEEGDKS